MQENKTTITLTLDSEVKKQAENVLEFLGLDIQTATNIFLNMCINVNGLPFDVKYPQVNEKIQEALAEDEEDDIIYGPFDSFDGMMASIHANA